MSAQSRIPSDPEQLPEPANDQVENREVRNPDAPEDPIDGESGDGLNQETGDDNPND